MSWNKSSERGVLFNEAVIFQDRSMNVNVQLEHSWNDTDRKTEVPGEIHTLLPLYPP
jgi:hypothetical protein